MQPLLRGFLALLMRPKLWGYVWKPLAWAAFVYLLLLVLGQMYLVPWITSKVPGSGWLESVVNIGGRVTFTIIWVIAANFLFLAIAALISSFLWDGLSYEAESSLFGDAPRGKLSLFGMIIDSLLRFFFAAVVLGVSLMFGWLGIVVGALAAGILSLVDFTAAAYLRRNIWFPVQLKVVQSPAAIGFIIGCGVLSLLPFAFVLLIPAMVVGGTILCRESESTTGAPDS